jgi:hypothetical protein
VQHFYDIVIVDGVVKLLGNSLELLEVNHSVLVLVEKGEDSLEAILGLGLTNSGGNDVDELILTDGFVLILETGDEVQNEWVSLVKAQLLKNFVDLNWINGSTAILIEDLEGVDELIVVLSSETVLPSGGDCLGDLAGTGSLFSGTGSSTHNILNELIIFNIEFLFRHIKRSAVTDIPHF